MGNRELERIRDIELELNYSKAKARELHSQFVQVNIRRIKIDLQINALQRELDELRQGQLIFEAVG